MNATSAQENEILGLEKKYWQAMKQNDVDAAVKLTKFPCVITSPRGAQTIEEQEYRKMMAAMKGEMYTDIEIENPKVSFLSQDTALISYSIKHNGMEMLDVSTWVREGGNWACAFHSENPINPQSFQ